jgi:Asp-tRNA(Asn)/Glu-tRNA(Gln) amidotransferase A subunit family amidase
MVGMVAVTYPFNLTQQPAAAVPCDLPTLGLPVSMQIVGSKYSDILVLRAGHAYEAARPFAIPSCEQVQIPSSSRDAVTVGQSAIA